MNRFEEYVNKLKENKLYRNMLYLDAPQSSRTIVNGKEILLLASNSYLGLCSNEDLKHAAIWAIQKFGVGSGGSRLTTGSYTLHKKLEEELSTFCGKEKAVLFSTGYAANLGTISSVADKSWVIFCDKLNHASIIDGIRLSGAKLVVYKHCDIKDLEEKIIRYHKNNSLIVTDGVFSMDGDIAPIDKIVSIAKKYNIMTMVDDAHGKGVLGKTGGGVLEYFDVKEQVDISMGTLSKAFASEGGYVAANGTLTDYIRHKAKSFIYSTALAPHNIAVALKALEVIKSNPWLRKNLEDKCIWFREQLNNIGITVTKNTTPIIPIIIGNTEKAVMFSKMLFEEGVYIPAIRPPTVKTSRLRISIMASHTYDDLDFALNKIKKAANLLCLIG